MHMVVAWAQRHDREQQWHVCGPLMSLLLLAAWASSFGLTLGFWLADGRPMAGPRSFFYMGSPLYIGDFTLGVAACALMRGALGELSGGRDAKNMAKNTREAPTSSAKEQLAAANRREAATAAVAAEKMAKARAALESAAQKAKIRKAQEADDVVMEATKPSEEPASPSDTATGARARPWPSPRPCNFCP